MSIRKCIVVGMAAMGLCATCLAAEQKAKDNLTPEERAAKKAAVREAMMRKTGGFIERPGSRKGMIAFINTQSRLTETNIMFVADSIAAKTRYSVRYIRSSKGEPLSLKASAGADVAVVVTDDPNAPAFLYAPEERYVVVNTAKLDSGLKTDEAKAKFFDARGRKQLLRAFAFVCGGWLSQFPGNIMEAKDIADLDLSAESLPADTLGKTKVYLTKVGVTAAQKLPYSLACREGWAPAPTNDIQKAVWDKVHSVPKNPIKIEFDPKKGR